MGSTFPTQKDIIPLFLDLNSNDSELVKNFQIKITEGNFSEANNILNQIENASQKIVSADRLNKLRDCILSLEQFYGTDIKIYIKDKQTEWENIINRFSYQLEYNSGVKYYKNNFVLYNQNGLNKLFICIKEPPTSNYAPNDENYWRVLTIQGERGATSGGTSSVFMFDWVSSHSYFENNIVVHDQEWWIAISENVNQMPQEGSQYWELVLKVLQPKYPVQKSLPMNQSIGELWFKVI